MSHHNALYGPSLKALSIALGGAVPLRGRTGSGFTIPAGEIVALFFNPAAGEVIGGYFFRGTGNVIAPLTIGNALYNPAPERVCVTRGTFGVLDVTKQLDRGGTVRVLQLPQSIEFSSTSPSLAEQDAAIAFIRAHPRTHVMGRELGEAPHYWHSHVVDNILAQEFIGLATTTANLLVELGRPRFSTLCILWEAYPLDRDYELTYAVTAYARYGTIGPLAALEQPIPTISQQAFSAANRALQDMGSVANAVGSGIVRGLGDVAEGAARYYGGRAIAAGAMRALPAIAAA